MARTKKRSTPAPHEGTLGIVLAPEQALEIEDHLHRVLASSKVGSVLLVISDDGSVERLFRRLGEGWTQGVTKIPNLDLLYEGPVWVLGIGAGGDDGQSSDSSG